MEKARFRQETILRHLKSAEIHLSSPFLHASSCSSGPSHEISNDDVVIVAACRTPICKAKRGAFKDTPAEDLLEHVLKAVLENNGVSPQEIGDVVVGNVLAMGNIRAAECRLAAFFAGFPESVPIKTVNRQCASGLQAVADVAAAIKSGFYEIGIAAGVESMSIDVGAHKPTFNPQVHIRPNQDAKDCLIPMGITSEIVAEQYKVSRLDQDKAALLSHKKAAEAATEGKFNDEIVPVYTKVIDHISGSERSVVVSADEGIRPDTSLSALSMLKPSFKDGGATTAGNSSQVSDGAAAVMLMKREVALQRCLPILGTFRSFSAVGVKPAVMGVGPAFAIPAAVKAAKLKLDDIDLFEINEAFASQYVYCLRKLGLDGEKVNVNGGAIALGHPVGATGARCVATLLHEMKRCGRTCRYGVVSMCMGSGMGGAAVFESE
ncbi:3-ketoacyl-CoA thiolase 1, peroxisomal-like [Magnolia sinica]|uniref:3-ketoacyl-CoA thiolase 1, peroxisomal-like n=1 Tax=Magnolia sinica TaxID=86752 RepID=UPI00265A6E82|nr:3-ketoacyl-CoA thiolase 1, peroxisomal-like [Magnolia sinica]